MRYDFFDFTDILHTFQLPSAESQLLPKKYLMDTECGHFPSKLPLLFCLYAHSQLHPPLLLRPPASLRELTCPSSPQTDEP